MAKNIDALVQNIISGTYDETFKTLYAIDGRAESLEKAKKRALSVIDTFKQTFSPAPDAEAMLVSGPGRTELGGNHTDHQHGHVLCGSVDLDIIGCAVRNSDNIIRVYSYGHRPAIVELSDLEIKPEEADSSVSIVRGIASRLSQMGYKLSGVDVYTVSDVLSGSGLSSSAAFEILIGNIMNGFFCGGELDAVALAKIGQYAENVYFGKPCGLMDQMGSSVGGAVAIDFNEPDSPVVKRSDYDFSVSGHSLCIIDTASTHSDLTDDYADITREMHSVANYFGKDYLRDVSYSDFRHELPALRKSCGDRAVLRAMHFYQDDNRAISEAKALENGDFNEFLRLINESGRSSVQYLQNIWSVSQPTQQAVNIALAVASELLNGRGAVRVHGGGFAGTIQAFVPNDVLSSFKSGIEEVLGEGRCHILHIRPVGGCIIG